MNDKIGIGALDVLGKDGEPRAGRVVALRLTLEDYADDFEVRLQTDANGRIERITDDQGDEWIYGYDPSGERLLTVTKPGSRILSYSYVDSDADDDYFDVRDATGMIAMFDGNPDHATDIEHEFIPPLVARYVRLHPKSWQNRPAMTWSLMGCAYGMYFEISWYTVGVGADSYQNSTSAV